MEQVDFCQMARETARRLSRQSTGCLLPPAAPPSRIFCCHSRNDERMCSCSSGCFLPLMLFACCGSPWSCFRAQSPLVEKSHSCFCRHQWRGGFFRCHANRAGRVHPTRILQRRTTRQSPCLEFVKNCKVPRCTMARLRPFVSCSIQWCCRKYRCRKCREWSLSCSRAPRFPRF